MKTNLPCENCITLGICKAFYNCNREDSDPFGTGTRKRMELKCSILKKWLHYSMTVGLIPENVKEFHRFYRGVKNENTM